MTKNVCSFKIGITNHIKHAFDIKGDNMVGLTENDIVYLLNYLKDVWGKSDRYLVNPSAFEGIRKVGKSYMFCCPVHSETKPSCGIMSEYPFGWHCFGCGDHGSLAKLVSIVIGGTEIYGEYFIEKLFYIDKGVEPPLKIKSLKHDIEILVKNRIERDAKNTCVNEKGILKYKGIRHPYMYQRGFNDRAIDKYELGYDDSTKSIVFPVRDHKGEIRFLQRRSVYGKSFYNDVGIYKKDILYGLYYIIQSQKHIDEIYLVESATDVISCYINKMPAVALMGRKFYDEMIQPLKVAYIRKINLFLDNDNPGWEAMEEIYHKLIKLGFEVTLPIYVNGYKDANELLIANKLNEVRFCNVVNFTIKQKINNVFC